MLTSLESTVKELAKIQKISKKCSVYDIHCSSLLEDASRNVQYVHFFFSFFFVKLKTLLFFRCIKLVLSLAHLLVFLSAERRSPKSNESQTFVGSSQAYEGTHRERAKFGVWQSFLKYT